MEDQIYAYHAEMCKVFAHPKRLELINTLLCGRGMGGGTAIVSHGHTLLQPPGRRLTPPVEFLTVRQDKR